MDNKQEIKMIRCLIANYGSYLDDKTAGYNNHDLCKALMKAIKSLEAWDKVIEDLENLSENMTDGVGGSKFTVNFIIKMIKEYMEGIEKCKEKNVKGL